MTFFRSAVRASLLSLFALVFAAILSSCASDAHAMSAYTVVETPGYETTGLLRRVCLDPGCGATEELKMKASSGLEYVKTDGLLLVSGRGDCRDRTLYISPVTPEGEKVDGIAAAAFLDDDTVTDLIVGEGISKIFDGAFAGCAKLRTVALPEKLELLDSEAFLHCSQLRSVRMPRFLDTISANLFNGCTSLQNVTLPEDLLDIGYSAFNMCSSLESVDFPETLLGIGSFAFADCVSLGSPDLPDNLRTIDVSAFSGCVKIERVVIPSSLETLESCAFYRCLGLREVFLPKEVSVVRAPDGMSPFYSSNPDLVVRTDADALLPGWDERMNVLYMPDVESDEDQPVYLKILFGERSD